MKTLYLIAYCIAGITASVYAMYARPVTLHTGIPLILCAILGISTILYWLLDDGKEVTQSPEIKDQHTDKDRVYLLLLMARSFHKAGKLILEKKHPSSENVILVFQLKNGNLRFSIKEEEIPDYIIPSTISINNKKINYKNNYRLITELLTEEE